MCGMVSIDWEIFVALCGVRVVASKISEFGVGGPSLSMGELGEFVCVVWSPSIGKFLWRYVASGWWLPRFPNSV